MNRREFLAQAGLVATWAAISVRISGCGEGENNPFDGGNGDVEANVALDAGHRHSARVTAAQIQAGNAIVLTLSTNSGHSHIVTLSAQQVSEIGAGTSVVDITEPDGTGHLHTVSFN